MNAKERSKRLYFGYSAIGPDPFSPYKQYCLEKKYPCAHSINELAGYIAAKVLEKGLADPVRVYYLGRDGHPLAGYLRKD